MADKLVLELSVDDKGTATIKNFAQASKQAMGEVSQATQQTSSHISSLKSGWGMMAAGIASSIYIFRQVATAVSSLTQDFLKQEEAEIKLAVAMRNQGDFSRTAYADMIQFAEGIQATTKYSDDATIRMMALLKTFGMTDDQVKRTTKTVLDFATAQGMDLQSAAMLMGKAFVGSTETLGRYGIRVEESLDRTQKFEAAMAQLEQRFGGAAQAELATYGGQLKYLSNMFSDIKELIGKDLMRVMAEFGPSVMRLGGIFAWFFKMVATGWGEIFGLLANLPDWLGGDKFKVVGEALKGVGATFGLIETGAEKAAVGIEGFKVKIEGAAAVAENMKAGQRFIPIDNESVKVAQKNQDLMMKDYEAYLTAMGKHQDDFEDEYYKFLQTQNDAQRKQAEEFTKMSEKEKETYIVNLGIMQDATEDAYNDAAQAAHAATQKKADEIWKIERKLTEDINKFTTDETQFKMDSLLAQAEAYKAMGVDVDRVNRWVFLQWQQYEEEKILKSNDFWAGIKVAYEQNTKDQITWAQQGHSIWNATFGKGGALESTLSSFFSDAFQGQLKTAEDYFKQFCNAILNAFANMIAQMIAQWVASNVASLFGVSLGSPGVGGGLVNTLIGGGGSTAGASAAGGGVSGGAAAAAGAGAAASAPELFGAGGAAIGAETGMGGAAAAAGAGGTEAAAGAAAGGMGAAGAAGAIGVGLAAWIYLASKYAPGTQTFLDPFKANNLTQSDLGYQALMDANFPVGSFIAGNQDRVKQIYDIVSANPFFSPENLKGIFQGQFGFIPSDEYSKKTGAPYMYLRGRPEYAQAVKDVTSLVNQYITREAVEVSDGAYQVDYVAMAKGGMINEPIVGRGRSGQRYLFGESGPEQVIPLAGKSGAGVTVNINVDGNLVADKNTFNKFVDKIHERLTQLQNWGYR